MPRKVRCNNIRDPARSFLQFLPFLTFTFRRLAALSHLLLESTYAITDRPTQLVIKEKFKKLTGINAWVFTERHAFHILSVPNACA